MWPYYSFLLGFLIGPQISGCNAFRFDPAWLTGCQKRCSNPSFARKDIADLKSVLLDVIFWRLAWSKTLFFIRGTYKINVCAHFRILLFFRCVQGSIGPPWAPSVGPKSYIWTGDNCRYAHFCHWGLIWGLQAFFWERLERPFCWSGRSFSIILHKIGSNLETALFSCEWTK